MSDIRDGQMNDPLRESLSDPGSVLQPATPPGSEVVLNEDGSATFSYGDADDAPADEDHFSNLAETLEQTRLSVIATDLLDAIEIDKDARQKRDDQYSEGLRRTGLGNDAPGGAPFAGASRATHPMLLESVVEYSSRVSAELLPPDGPVKAQIIGTPTDDKSDRGERLSRYMNWQLTEAMPSAYSEIEQGLTQQGLAGAFYTKMVVTDGKPDVVVVHIDAVHRPWNDGDFYSQQRITHEQHIDRWEFEENVRSGLWLDVVDPAASSDTIEQTNSSIANDRIIGRDQPTTNVDDVRTVFEISTKMALDGEDDDVRPYLVTIDEQTRKVLSIYRNWEEKDANHGRLDFLIEWPFLPWRGGYPIGMTHMIGSLSGAASGALRALLDAALLNTMQTGVKLKGGATSGGQNIRPQVGSTTEMQGTLVNDDIRKTYLPLVFPPPSPVLFQLLGFLVDAGRGVIRTTFDEFSKMSGEMPVGTANLMVEQGLKAYGAVFGRQHRAMRRFLRQLWSINKATVQNEQVVDQFGELLVTKEDFTGPMCVVPVSDPHIFTDTQRQVQAQLVSSRAQFWSATPTPIYKARAAELFLMKQMKIAQPEQFLIDAPEPSQVNAATENVLASQGQPIKAYMGQDHEAHVAQHGAYMQAKLFGMNPIIAMKFLPGMLAHLADHISLWYADAMLLATNAVLQKTFDDPRITLEALQTVKGLEASLDRLMAEITPDVLQHADQVLGPTQAIIAQAQALMKQMTPPQPMDPSIVAQQDVQRQAQADQANAKLKGVEVQGRQQTDAQRLAVQQQKDQADGALKAQKQQQDAELAQQKLEQDARDAERRDMLTAAGIKVQDRGHDVALETSRDNNDTTLETTREDNETALQIVSKKIAADGSAGNISDGEGVQK